MLTTDEKPLRLVQRVRTQQGHPPVHKLSRFKVVELHVRPPEVPLPDGRVRTHVQKQRAQTRETHTTTHTHNRGARTHAPNTKPRYTQPNSLPVAIPRSTTIPQPSTPPPYTAHITQADKTDEDLTLQMHEPAHGWQQHGRWKKEASGEDSTHE